MSDPDYLAQLKELESQRQKQAESFAQMQKDCEILSKMGRRLLVQLEGQLHEVKPIRATADGRCILLEYCHIPQGEQQNLFWHWTWDPLILDQL